MTAKKITNRSFFTCSAEELAPKLLGKILCHKESDGFVIKCRIRVTEAMMLSMMQYELPRLGRRRVNLAKEVEFM